MELDEEHVGKLKELIESYPQESDAELAKRFDRDKNSLKWIPNKK